MDARSFLFIPADSQKKLSKADSSGADAVILDLEDSVVSANKSVAREQATRLLSERPRGVRSSQLWVRINPLSSALALDDLVAVVAAAPDGIMLPKANGPDDVRILSNYLDALEAQSGVEAGSVRILPVVTETAIAPFQLGDYAQAKLSRLAGLTWGAEDLSAALGASTNLDQSGEWAFTYKFVRSLTLLAARAADVPAIETLYVDFRDDQGLRESSRAARAEGFAGRVAIHPAQVAPINECFSPSPEEIEHARRVMEAFASAPNAGTVGLDGRMIDIPHLKQAEQVLSQSRERGRE